MGAWIETLPLWRHLKKKIVAPLMGAWIETNSNLICYHIIKVAPLMGAWIETLIFCVLVCHYNCRTSHGCVD